MRLSDFQIADAPIVVDQHLMARNAKAARRQVNSKKTSHDRHRGSQRALCLLTDGRGQRQ